MEIDPEHVSKLITSEQYYGRRTGKTFRMLLRALLLASSRENTSIAIIGHNRPWCADMMKQLLSIAAPLGMFVSMFTPQIEVHLKNGSKIYFVPDQSFDHWSTGRKLDVVWRDIV